MKGPVAAARIMPQASNATIAARLWDVSAKLTGVDWKQEKEAR